MKKLITVNADKLRNLNPTVRQLNEEVKRLGMDISQKISEAHYAKLKSIVYEMPTVFDIFNIEQTTAKLFIYSSIIEALEDESFDVCADISKRKCTFYISWNTEMPTAQYKAMVSVLQRSAKKFEPSKFQSAQTTLSAEQKQSRS